MVDWSSKNSVENLEKYWTQFSVRNIGCWAYPNDVNRQTVVRIRRTVARYNIARRMGLTLSYSFSIFLVSNW